MRLTDPAFDEHFWSYYPRILRPVDRSRHVALGLSGAMVWKVMTESGLVAVRQFPTRRPPAPAESLTPFHDVPPFDHHTMMQARLHGWSEVPQPLPNNDGQTFTKHADFWWDVCTWQPGKPARLPISAPTLKAALRFIGRWHGFWNKSNAGFDPNHIDADAIGRRSMEWRRLWRSEWAYPGLWDGDENDPLGLSGRTARAVKARARKVEGQLHHLPPLLAHEPKVNCHGDLHREHVLFTGDVVTGFIDLSCRWDYAAADLARWLSTTAEPNRWAEAVEWYREVAPLSAASERAIPLLAETGLVIAALRWERWLLGHGTERRFFPRPDLAYDQWRVIVERLERAEL